jgi:hypothetical protein
MATPWPQKACLNAGGIVPLWGLANIQAKRKKHKERQQSGMDILWGEAGQMFCEMLGQVCYKEFYENPKSEYQEVPPSPVVSNPQAFVIYGTHSTISIYYTKLPNTYLADIAKHGIHYLQRSTSKQHVKLRCTKKYHMRVASERVELFLVLAKLLWYLISGKSHVGYLFNYDGNPLHRLVLQ